MAGAPKPNYPEAHHNSEMRTKIRAGWQMLLQNITKPYNSDPIICWHIQTCTRFPELHQWDDAIVCCRRVLEIDPLYAEGLHT